jgi:predicted nucleic acid-binding protein
VSSYYFDTSALVKRYAAEVGSAWVRTLTAHRSGNVIYASAIARPEVVGALWRKVREG